MIRSGDLVRVLYVTPFDEPVSGADESLLLAIRNLNKGRVEPHVLVPPASNYIERYKEVGAKVHLFPMSRMRRNFNPLFWTKFLWSLRTDVRKLPELLNREKIAVVHLNMHVALGALLAARREKLPVVVHYRAKTNDRPRLFFDLYLPWLYRQVASVLCISQAVARHFFSRGFSGKVEVVYNPVDLQKFSPDRSANPYAAEPLLAGKKIVLFVGRVHPQKRIDVFLQALSRISLRRNDVAGVVVGSPADDQEDVGYFTSLQEFTKKAGLTVQFVPHQTSVQPYMANADLFVLPSVNEGFGRVLVEAMACGLPVIGSNSGAIPEVLEEGRWGMVFPADDAEALADSIERELSDAQVKARAREALVHVKENFSVAAHVDKLMEVYERITR